MKAYIQTATNGEFYNVNAFVANEGFVTMGWETLKYTNIEEITDLDPEILVVGGIGNVRKRLKQLGLQTGLKNIDYPEELRHYLGRKVWASTLPELFKTPDKWNVFVKPQDETKKSTGKVIRTDKDFIGLLATEESTKIWCSELVNFVTEWRCFVRYGKILDIRQYKGAWDSKLQLKIVEDAIKDFRSAPAAYALDFGIDDKGVMKLVECNDGYALGTYGIGAVNYAKLLSARWSQLTHTQDFTNF